MTLVINLIWEVIIIDKVQYILQLQSEGKTRHEIKDIVGYKLLDSMTKYMKKNGYKVENNIYVIRDDSCHQNENVEISTVSRNDDNSMTEVIEVINEGIKIDLPESETTRTTIRINKVIWEDFDVFCNENKEFNKQDFMAQALKDFMRNNEKR